MNIAKTTSVMLGKSTLLKKIRKIWLDRHTSLIVMSFIIGILAASANIVFRSTMRFVRELIFVGGSELLQIDGGWPFRALTPLLPMAGAALLVPFAMKYSSEVSGYSFHKFLETVNLKGGVLKARTLILKTIGPALTIGSGGSAGVEGPIAAIGGTIGSLIGQLFKASGSRMKLLIAAGSAGAIAATFNAPIAGVMFAMEIVLLGNYELTSFAAIVISSGIATVISRGYYGPHPAFMVPQYSLKSPYELLLYIVLGLVIAVLAVLYIKVFYRIKDAFASSRISVHLRPIAGAFMVGVIGIFLPQVMSDGYDVIEKALAGDIVFEVVLLLIFFKILATSLTLGSGGAGGVFAPALFIGAMIGGSFGHIVNILWPEFTASPGAYATVGIGSFLAAATHAPLTGIFLVFEMTGDYQIIVPVMFASIIGTLLAKRIYSDSIDTVELSREGIDIHAGQEAGILGTIKVGSIMTGNVVTVERDKSLTELVNIMIGTERFYIPVVDGEGLMVGIISIHDVRPVLLEEYVKGIVTAGELATEEVITLRPGDDLNVAAASFSKKDIDEIPVVDPSNPRKVLGMLRRSDLFAAYNKEVLKRERDRDFGATI